MVLTHFDDDHIGGILKWLNKDKEAFKLIKEVWFNSGQEIAAFLSKPENEELTIKGAFGKATTYTSVSQGITFEEYLYKHNICNEELIIQGKELERFGAKFRFLSPNKKCLEGLLKLYEKEKDYFTRGSRESDFDILLKEFISEENEDTSKFEEDTSVANGSSIAFILEYEGKNYLFLADAYSSVIIEGLNDLDYDLSNPITVELMKVSHHGSKFNTSKELLEIVKTDNYVISSDGTRHNLPNKRTIARIIDNNPNAHIYFNYDLKDRIFKEQDWEDYSNFKSKMKTEF